MALQRCRLPDGSQSELGYTPIIRARYYFCNRRCVERFQQDPERFLARRSGVRPVLTAARPTLPSTLGQTYELCSEGHRLASNRTRLLLHAHDWGRPSLAYYISIGLTML